MAHEDHHIEIDTDGMSEEKLERIKGKLDAFMGDIASELVDDDTREKIMKTVQHKLKMAGVIGNSLSTLKAFQTGFEMSIGCPDMSVRMAITTTIREAIQKKQAAIDSKAKDAGI